MEDDRVKVRLARHAQMKDFRTVWEGHWRQITRRVLPRQDDFQGSGRTPGAPRTEYIFDSTAPLALERFAAAMEGMLAPRAERWHRLTSTDKDLNKIPRVQRYFEQVADILFAERYAPHANYASQLHETMVSLGSIGTGALFVDWINGRGLGYKSIHLSEIYVAEDQHGRVDTLHREFEFTHRQAAQKWGEENLPAKIREKLKKNPDEKSTYLHVIMPREGRDPNRLDFRGMAFTSEYYSLECKELLSEGGYRTMPIPVSRYVTAPRETYGRSPAMQVLPDIKMANEIAKTALRAVHKAVDPPLLLSDDGVLGRVQTKPGGISVGGLNSRGNALVAPLSTDARIDWALAMLEQSRKTINDGFMITLFEILVDSPDRMTATEVLERMREKGVLLAPTMGRQETELLGPQIEREIDLLAHAGRLPEMPGELIEAEGAYRIQYENPLARSQRAQQATGFTTWVNAMAPIAQVKPEVFDTLDVDTIGRDLGDVLGMPPSWFLTPDALEEKNADRADAESVAQLAAVLPAGAKAAVDMAKAEQLTGAALV